MGRTRECLGPLNETRATLSMSKRVACLPWGRPWKLPSYSEKLSIRRAIPSTEDGFSSLSQEVAGSNCNFLELGGRCMPRISYVLPYKIIKM